MRVALSDRELEAHYERYGSLLHDRCVALLGTQADADDALQEVFVRLHRYGPPRDGITLAWFYTLANHCCFDLRKRRDREEPHEDAVEKADRVGVGNRQDPDRRAALGAVLRRLDARTREIGILHHLDGYTQEEVAEKTGYSRKTVRKKLAAFNEAFEEPSP